MNRYHRLLLTSALAAALSLALGCNSTTTSPDVVAKVNGHKIQKAEVDKYFDNQTAGTPQPPTEEQATSLRLSILKELIDNEILMQRAEKLGLLATNEEEVTMDACFAMRLSAPSFFS